MERLLRERHKKTLENITTLKIQFESTTKRNAKCKFCPRYDMTRPQGEMSDELFHKIIEEGKKFRKAHFVPFLNGEPFVFSRIWGWLD